MTSTTRRGRRGAVTGTLLRFVSCGLLSLAFGLAWRFTLAPHRVGVTSALAGILFLLSGFLVGGTGWYLRDRRALADDDERLGFSLIVFAVIPLAVLVLVAVIWVATLALGAATNA